MQAPDIPKNFKLDTETAARLRPQLLEQSVAPTGKYETGRMVFERLIQKAESSSLTSSNLKFRSPQSIRSSLDRRLCSGCLGHGAGASRYSQLRSLSVSS